MKLYKVFILIFLTITTNLNLANAQISSSMVRQIKDSGVIKIGVEEGSMPFSYQDYRGVYIGYSVDLCKKIVEDLKKSINSNSLSIRFIPVSSANRIPLIANHTLDMVCGAATNNLDREKFVSFSSTIYIAAGRVLVRKSSKITSFSDLQNKTLGLITGGSINSYVNQSNNNQNLNIKIVYSKDGDELFSMLNNGSIDAIATDDVMLAALVANSNNPDQYVILNQTLSVEPYGIMMPLDDLNFKKLVNGILMRIYQSGQIGVIYDKWFLSPIPTRGINLNMPMSSSLREVFNHPTDSGDPIDYLPVSGVKTE